MVWLAIATSIVIFVILLVAYVIRQAGPGWSSVRLPLLFVPSTGAILLSSIALNRANYAFRHEQFGRYRFQLTLTLLLGCLFMALQIAGWWQMTHAGQVMRGSASVGFIYLLTGLHLLHILVGLCLLGVALFEAWRHRRYVDAFVYRMNPPNQLKIKLLTLYWHFVDLLWIGIFLFLIVHHGLDFSI